jgi:hypothetical protein
LKDSRIPRLFPKKNKTRSLTTVDAAEVALISLKGQVTAGEEMAMSSSVAEVEVLNAKKEVPKTRPIRCM